MCRLPRVCVLVSAETKVGEELHQVTGVSSGYTTGVGRL